MSPFYDSAVFVFDDLLNFLFESYALGPGSSFYILRVTGLLMRFVLPSILLGQAFCEKFIFPIFSHEAVKLKLCSALRMLSMSCFFARSTACITPFISFFFSFLFSYFSNSTCSLMNSFSLFCGRALASNAASVLLFGPVTLLRMAKGFMSYTMLLLRASFL